MGHPWWQRLRLWIPILWILIFTGCATPNTVAVTSPSTETADSSSVLATTVRVAENTGFAIDYRVTSQWGNGFTAEITLQNSSADPIPAWTLNWTFPQDPTQITNLWNGTHSQTGNQVTVSNLSHNSLIPAGGSINFGFQASYPGGDLTTPVEFVFNGQPLSQPTPTPASLACLVDYSISSSWNEGFVANLTIRNLGGSVTGWTLGFDFPVDSVTITNLWNGTVTQTGRTVQVTNLDWNKTIPANGTANVGFQAAHQGGSLTPTGFRLNDVPCTGQPATPIPTPSGVPIGDIRIDNFTIADGTPLVIGQTLELNATAGDSNGNNISSQIEWSDSSGAILGSGGRLVYRATSVKTETLTARIQLSGQEEKSKKVSFTISDPAWEMAPNVKGLQDKIASDIILFDGQEKILRIKNSSQMPSIKTGDVIVGANFRVPPVKITDLSYDESTDQFDLKIEFAYPGDVIKKSPDISEWLPVNLDTNSSGIIGEARVKSTGKLSTPDSCLLRLPKTAFEFPIIQTPPLSLPISLPEIFRSIVFRDSKASIGGQGSIGFGVQSSFCLGIQPLLRFNNESEGFGGIPSYSFRVEMSEVETDLELIFSGQANITGNFVTNEQKLYSTPPFLLVPGQGFDLPVSFWLSFDLYHFAEISPSIQISGDIRPKIRFTDGRFGIDSSYSETENPKFNINPYGELGNPSLVLGSNIFINGSLESTYYLEVAPLIWPSAVVPNPGNPLETVIGLPRVGFGITSTLTTDTRGKAELEVITPENDQPYNANQEIPLSASVNNINGRATTTFGLKGLLGKKQLLGCREYFNKDGVSVSDDWEEGTDPYPTIPENKIAAVNPSAPPGEFNGCYTHSENQKRIKCYGNLRPTRQGDVDIPNYQSHHIIQHAALRDPTFTQNYPRYSGSKAATVILRGGSHKPGSAHELANISQSRTEITKHIPRLGEGNLDLEFKVAKEALEAAQGDQIFDIEGQMFCAKKYLESIGIPDGNYEQVRTTVPENRYSSPSLPRS